MCQPLGYWLAVPFLWDFPSGGAVDEPHTDLKVISKEKETHKLTFPLQAQLMTRPFSNLLTSANS